MTFMTFRAREGLGEASFDDIYDPEHRRRALGSPPFEEVLLSCAAAGKKDRAPYGGLEASLGHVMPLRRPGGLHWPRYDVKEGGGGGPGGPGRPREEEEAPEAQGGLEASFKVITWPREASWKAFLRKTFLYSILRP